MIYNQSINIFDLSIYRSIDTFNRLMDRKDRKDRFRDMWVNLPVLKDNFEKTDSKNKYDEIDEYDDISIIKFKFIEILKLLVQDCKCARHPPLCMLRYEACEMCIKWVDDIDTINLLIEVKIHDTWVKNVRDENIMINTKPYLTKEIVDRTSYAMNRIQMKLTNINLANYLFPD